MVQRHLSDDWKQEVKQKLEKIRDRGTIKITRLEKIIDELDRNMLRTSKIFIQTFKFPRHEQKDNSFEALRNLKMGVKFNDRYGGMYEKFRNEWIEKSTYSRFDSAYITSNQ